MADAKVLQIPEGSVLVLIGVDLDIGVDEQPVVDSMLKELRDVVGHERFLVLQIPTSGDAVVWGPDTDLRAELTALLDQRKEADG